MYEIEEMIPHRSYNNPEYAHDIALLKVRDRIEFSEKVQSVFPFPYEVPVNTPLNLTGWGLLDVSIDFHFFNLIH